MTVTITRAAESHVLGILGEQLRALAARSRLEVTPAR